MRQNKIYEKFTDKDLEVMVNKLCNKDQKNKSNHNYKESLFDLFTILGNLQYEISRKMIQDIVKRNEDGSIVYIGSSNNNSFNDFIVERLNKIDIVEKYSSLRFDICKNISNGINDSKQYFEIAKDIIKIMESYCLDEELDYVYIDLISLLDDEESIRKYVGNIRKMAISSEKRMNKNLWTIYSIKGRKNEKVARICLELLGAEYLIYQGVLLEKEDSDKSKIEEIERKAGYIGGYIDGKVVAACALKDDNPENLEILMKLIMNMECNYANDTYYHEILRSAYENTKKRLESRNKGILKRILSMFS